MLAKLFTKNTPTSLSGTSFFLVSTKVATLWLITTKSLILVISLSVLNLSELFHHLLDLYGDVHVFITSHHLPNAFIYFATQVYKIDICCIVLQLLWLIVYINAIYYLHLLTVLVCKRLVVTGSHLGSHTWVLGSHFGIHQVLHK